MILIGAASEIKGLQISENIRDAVPGVKMITHCGGGSLKSQMKKADKSGAGIALIIAEDELENEQVTVKYLREKKEQETVSVDQLAAFITKIV
jgi:histidyl-tRNA synthetase